SHSSRRFAHSLFSQVSIRETFDRSVPALARYLRASSSYGTRSRMASLNRLQRSSPNFPLRSSNNRRIRGSILSWYSARGRANNSAPLLEREQKCRYLPRLSWLTKYRAATVDSQGLKGSLGSYLPTRNCFNTCVVTSPTASSRSALSTPNL